MTTAPSYPALDLGLVVTSLPAALRFYRDTLGLVEGATMQVPRVGELTVLTAGESVLRLIQLDRPPQHHAVPGGVRAGATGVRYVGLRVPSVADAVARCQAAGYDVVMAPTTAGPAVVAAVADPDGNSVEFLERLG